MISTTKTGVTAVTKEKNYVMVELRGLSTDTKPTQIGENYIDNGSTFIEIDTGDIYMFDLENNEWHKI